MKLLCGQDAAVAQFVADRIGVDAFLDYAAIGVLDRADRLVAGIVWNNWDEDCGVIEFSGASITPNWMTRGILRRIFGFAFEALGAQMIMTRNASSNVRLHRQLTAYGFTRFDIPRMFGRSKDGVLWTLTDDAFRASRFN